MFYLIYGDGNVSCAENITSDASFSFLLYCGKEASFQDLCMSLSCSNYIECSRESEIRQKNSIAQVKKEML